MAIRVVNKKTGGRGNYIGRPSVFGNPFVIGHDGSRADVIRKYRTWFWEQVEAGGALAEAFAKLLDRARAGEDINLVCWCAPLACHGDVIKQAIEDELRLDRERTAAEINANTQ